VVRAWNDLRDFLAFLEERDELCRVAAEVDPRLEIAAVTDRVSKGAGRGRALLFERVRGHAFAVATNLFGSRQRAAWALGVEDVETIAERLGAELATLSGDAAGRLRELTWRTLNRPSIVPAAPCRECEEEADLRLLPALQAWPRDGGRFLTLPQVFTRHPESGETNCGMYRMQIFDGRRAGLNWRPGSDASRHYAAWRARGERMPVAVALGGDPALTYAAGAPLPPGADEVAYAGILRGAPVSMTPCRESDLLVPAGAEFVLEGYVEPHGEALEGPFGNHTGGYAPAGPVPVFHLATLNRRSRAICPCTVVGPPPMEDCWLAKASERLLLPLLRIDFPAVVDLNYPIETIFHGCALVSARIPAAGGRALLEELRRSELLRSARLLLLLEEGVDVHDPAEAYWQAVNRVDPARDIMVEGGRVAIDATRSRGGPRVVAAAETQRLLNRRWSEYGLD